MKFLAGLLAFISSLYTGDLPSDNLQKVTPLNATIISYSDTYFAPTVAEPGNFPKIKMAVLLVKPEEAITEIKSKITTTTIPAKTEILPPSPSAPAIPTSTPSSLLLPQPPVKEDPYISKTEPILNWLSTNLSFRGTSSEDDRTLPEIIFDREYWRMEIFTYWAPDVTPPKPEVEKDYVKIEIYEATTNKLIHTITSGSDESIHKFQSFKKPGKYYFKVNAKTPSQWEITFTVSPKTVQ